MIKYLNHELIDLTSLKCERDYLPYICNKCNKVIFRTCLYADPDAYWMYKNGVCMVPNSNDIMWHFLTLTCEEEMIKDLLE
jgi:hypothetical protein